MESVIKNEFIKLFKSIKAVIIIAILIATSYYSTKFIMGNKGLIEGANLSTQMTASIQILIYIFGIAFVFVLSHNCINQEIQTQTIRFIVPKISRKKFILGKFMGISLFWYSCMSISFIIIAVMSNQNLFKEYVTVNIFITYMIALTLLLSTIISKTSLSNFVGIVLSVFLPFFGAWVTVDTNSKLSIVKYLLPYHYLVKEGVWLAMPILISVAYITLAIIIFDRKEL